MELGESNYSLISSPYDSFMRKHLQHYGYFTGRSEIVKKYGFVPSKSQLISSSSDSDLSSGDDEPTKYKGKPFVPDRRLPIRQNRISYNLRGQNDDNSFEPRWPIEIEVLTESRIKHINAPPKHPELFYKPTPSHTPFVRSFDENNGRVVFNYCPETCGYFMRSRIGGNRDGCRQAGVIIRNSEDTTVLFESRFESGNLMKAVQVGEYEYELYLRYDLYTKRNTQWFYFRLQNIRANKRYRFTIVNFFKPTSLYNNGMKPLMYSVSDADDKGIGWRRWGEEIVYYKNNLTAPDNPSSNMYSLTWTCKFPNDNDTYYFAHCYPYTYSDLQDYLNEIQNDRAKSEYCKQKVLCRTLAGNFVYMLTITSPTSNPLNMCTSPEQQVKKGVVVTARVHPGETNASWMMKGLLDFLLNDSEDAKLLRDNFIFKIVPMLNPDGVIVGNYRCSLSGRDLNRNYKTILKDAYPSIWHTREMIKRFMSETELILYCDFHGHSRKQNVFIYGCENKHLPRERLKERIFPAMLSKNDPAKFAYYSCKFKVQKNKEGTGRIVMWAMGIPNSYTLEATFCGSTQRDRASHQFNTRDLESIGYHFLDSLLDYCDPDHTKRNRLLNELEDNLRRNIQMKLLSRGINTTSVDEIDIDQWSSDDDSSDDGGSDSSIDDGLPKHLEIIAAAKVRLKKTKKKRSNTKALKDSKRKEEIDKDNAEKNKPVGLLLPKSRNIRFPTIALLETNILTTDNNDSSDQIMFEKSQQRPQQRKRCRSEAYLVSPCFACLSAQIPRMEETASVDDTAKTALTTSVNRGTDTNDSSRHDGSNETTVRSSRWPTLLKTSNSINRLTPTDEKAQRSQAEYYKILTRDMMLNKQEKSRLSQQLSDDDFVLTASSLFPSQQSSTKITYEQEYSIRYSSMSSRQNNITNEMRLVNEPRDAFTATYLLRRLNSIERESAGNSANLTTAMHPVLASASRIDEDNPPHGIIDTEGELDISRTTVEIRSEDSRQQLNTFVTNRVSTHLNERILGAPRSVSRPKSSTIVNLQNRSILDIRSVQAPVPTINPKRTTEPYQHHPQRQRLTMGIGIRSMPLNEKKSEDPTTYHENSSISSSRTLPLRPDNIPINLVSRYETTTLNHLATLNKMQTIRISSVRKSTNMSIFKNSSSQSLSMGVESGQMLTKLTSDNDGHRQSSVISFHSLNYKLKSQQCCNILPMPCLNKKQQNILNNMSGIFKQGMNAILGSTGSGKSSLLDILADRKDRQGLEGQVLINGQPQASDFKYQVGYVVQDDVVSGNLTVKENLMFSANVRLSTKLSSSEKNQIVDEVIVQLGLEKCANSVVGTEFKRGISGGERKRTNIGMELVLSPNVLFLDEPTTGK
ncbi:unnamed protein product [Rotaria magnacalcarata]|uniref:Peptidase M14 domain-containing protein n=2 Tax=Rotaria magnacalcarata TaxID=392030 RepID=A0A819N1I3_9BILA|nr:unnamed protein product [Rotaria magnacalcarata]